MREEILHMERITYRKQGMALLENFSMTIQTGGILGLVPINRLGLSALVRLLQQNLPLHYDYVYYEERLVNDWRFPCTGINRTIMNQTAINRAAMNRVSVIRNRSCLAGGLTVADNIFVLRPGSRKRLMQPYILREQLKPFMEGVGTEIPANAYVEELTNFKRFMVELLKAVVVGNHLVVLEDISTFINDVELKRLSGILHHYAKRGMSLLYVATHFEEARQVCGRTALMLNGQIVEYFQAKDKTPDPLFLHRIEDFDRHVREQMNQRPRPEESQVVFQVEGEPMFPVTRGECLVMQGLSNCMIQELPVHSMLFSGLSYLDSPRFTLDHWVRGMWGSRRIKKSLRQEYVELLGREVFDLPMDRLTKRQKYDLICARIYLQNPKVVFCVQPFKSVGVALRIHIMELLERFLSEGIPMVIMVINLADSLALTDRLLRVRRSGEVQEYHRDELAALPVNTPWLCLHQEKYREEWQDGVDGRRSVEKWQAEQLN